MNIWISVEAKAVGDYYNDGITAELDMYYYPTEELAKASGEMYFLADAASLKKFNHQLYNHMPLENIAKYREWWKLYHNWYNKLAAIWGMNKCMTPSELVELREQQAKSNLKNLKKKTRP